ncbi:PspA/IM30 family protein [Anoxybacillus rupiensis]|uniref:PspA/IM30 family protein n=1 Tax=Anoxybacteroides rupiense TaxID=311460 RepID=A0ABD5IR05_9BACL|nr:MULTISPECIES: PspA/IM30 family protein [Anoxybacillus]KXG08310.1 Phage shock protein A [Anoxybacillus sp. P3H1B]MBB3907774.1 phage shock protein A [Anoxybacillus rupiensis]MDE8563439.1 PspA/IM30 family protein [Anoxybacillus rupiensis]MED5050720.1 PspA/IM30 family protein [Anoxybacillus rupiensis]QHC02911.1 PspA/IM30 family protein [Anoxybacillus sp. PDR2]
MGIFKRLKRIVTADLHDWIDKCEDPIRMTKQYLRELNEQIDNTQQALAQQFAIQQRYEMLIHRTEEIVKKRERQAKLAIEKEEEAIAKMALQEKISYEKKLETYKQQYNTLIEKTTYLNEQLKKLKEKYEELKIKHFDFIARAHAAKAITDVNTSLVSFNPEQILKGFERIEEHVRSLEAKAKASTYVYETQKTLSLPPVFHEEVEQELAKLKTAK